MKFIISILFVFEIIFAKHIFWQNNYKKAFEIAKKEKKIVMVFIFKKNCRYCEYMKKFFLKDNIYKILNKNFVLIKYNQYDIPNFFKEHFYEFLPTIMFYSYNRKFLYGINGAIPEQKFLKIINLYKKRE